MPFLLTDPIPFNVVAAPAERARHSLQSLQTQLTERQAELNRLKEEADGAKKDNADLKVLSGMSGTSRMLSHHVQPLMS